MKRTASYFILLTAVVYTVLFYRQYTGINYLLFDTLLVVLLLLTESKQFKRSTVLISSLGMMASAAFVFVNNTFAAVIMHWISFGLFVKLFYDPNLSPYLAFVEQIWISICSLFRLFKWKKLATVPGSNKGMNWLIYFSTLPIVCVFILLYSSGNEVYHQLVYKLFEIDLDIEMAILFASGLVLAFAVFAPFSLVLIKAFDLSCHNQLEYQEGSSSTSLFGNMPNELKAGCFLLIMLNLVTLSLHATDAYTLFVPSATSLSYSDNVHQGVNSLIVSIVLAIVIVTYFFRGEMNFLSENKGVKFLTYAWLSQNLLLIASTGYKNLIYISELGLTHKRIGVLVWLVIVVLGILFTFLKVSYKKSVWYLLRANTWSVYVILLVYSSIHWNRWIVTYNTSYAKGEVDYAYLQRLDPSTYATLEQLSEEQKAKLPHAFVAQQFVSAQLHDQAYQQVGWPSFNLESERIAQSLQNSIHTK